jgi:hypothetical protein
MFGLNSLQYLRKAATLKAQPDGGCLSRRTRHVDRHNTRQTSMNVVLSYSTCERGYTSFVFTWSLACDRSLWRSQRPSMVMRSSERVFTGSYSDFWPRKQYFINKNPRALQFKLKLNDPVFWNERISPFSERIFVRNFRYLEPCSPPFSHLYPRYSSFFKLF